jgi:hypothetical protein
MGEHLWETFVYYRMVGGRAISDSLRHIVRQVLVGAVLLALGTLIGCVRGADCKVNDLKTGLAAVAIYFGAVFVFNLVMAPVRIHREQVPPIPKPRLVTLVAKELRDPTLQETLGHGNDYSYSAHQIKDGIELTWSVLRREGDKLPPYLPRDARCTLQTGEVADVCPRYFKITCVYPRDFGVVPTTGHVDLYWEGSEITYPLPPSRWIRGEPRATPPEPTWELQRFAWWSLDVEVKEGDELV